MNEDEIMADREQSWRERDQVASEDQYDPTATPLADANTGTVIVVVRDPDASNDYRAFTRADDRTGADLFFGARRRAMVAAIDIDAGHMDLRDPDEYAEWAEGFLNDTAPALDAARFSDAADYVREVVADYAPEGGNR